MSRGKALGKNKTIQMLLLYSELGENGRRGRLSQEFKNQTGLFETGGPPDC